MGEAVLFVVVLVLDMTFPRKAELVILKSRYTSYMIVSINFTITTDK